MSQGAKCKAKLTLRVSQVVKKRWNSAKPRIVQPVLIKAVALKRTPFHLAVPDVGSPAVSVMVKDVKAALEAVKAGGGSVVTAGGEPVKLGNAIGIFVRDPNGLLIELIPGT